MDNKCAFCAQLVEHFTRCNECGEAICADHRTLMPVGPRPAYAGIGLGTPARYLCPNHVGLLTAAQAATVAPVAPVAR